MPPPSKRCGLNSAGPLRMRPRRLCSPYFLHKEIASGEMALIDIHEPWMQISYGLIWRKNSRPSGALKSFVDLLVETQRERDGGDVPLFVELGGTSVAG